MKKSIATQVMLTMAVVLLSTAVFAQGSPAQTATGKANGATITIAYHSPSVKGRKIWGDLVPYDKVWRAGADQATTVEFDKDVTVEGKAVPKGKYSLYAIPGQNEWSIILNSATGQWGINRDGTTTRDAAKDVAVVKVKPAKAGATTEALTYRVTDKGFSLVWENVEVPVSVK